MVQSIRPDPSFFFLTRIYWPERVGSLFYNVDTTSYSTCLMCRLWLSLWVYLSIFPWKPLCVHGTRWSTTKHKWSFTRKSFDCNSFLLSPDRRKRWCSTVHGRTHTHRVLSSTSSSEELCYPHSLSTPSCTCWKLLKFSTFALCGNSKHYYHIHVDPFHSSSNPLLISLLHSSGSLKNEFNSQFRLR